MYLEPILIHRRIPVAATDGKATLLSSRLFVGRVCGETLRTPSMKETKATHFDLYELVKDGTFRQIFGSLKKKLGSFEWAESQVVEIVQKRENRKRLDNRGHGTLFRIKGAGVVNVSIDGELCEAHVEPFTFPLPMLVKNGRHRFALPSVA